MYVKTFERPGVPSTAQGGLLPRAEGLWGRDASWAWGQTVALPRMSSPPACLQTVDLPASLHNKSALSGGQSVPVSPHTHMHTHADGVRLHCWGLTGWARKRGLRDTWSAWRMRPDALLGCLVGPFGFRPVNSLLCASPLSVRCRLPHVQQAWPVPVRGHPCDLCPLPRPPSSPSGQRPVSRVAGPSLTGVVWPPSPSSVMSKLRMGEVKAWSSREQGGDSDLDAWASPVTPPAARLGHQGTPSAWLSGACPWTHVCTPAHRLLPTPTRGLDEPLDRAPRALKPHSPASSPGGPRGPHPAPRLQPRRLGLPQAQAEAPDSAGRHGGLLPRGDASPAPVFEAGGPSAPAEAERSPLPTPGRTWRGSAVNQPCALLAGLLLIRRRSGRRVCSDSLSWAARISRSSRPLLRRAMCAGEGRGAGGGPYPDHTLSSASPCSGGFLGREDSALGKSLVDGAGQFGSGKQKKY